MILIIFKSPFPDTLCWCFMKSFIFEVAGMPATYNTFYFLIICILSLTVFPILYSVVIWKLFYSMSQAGPATYNTFYFLIICILSLTVFPDTLSYRDAKNALFSCLTNSPIHELTNSQIHQFTNLPNHFPRSANMFFLYASTPGWSNGLTPSM